MTAHGIADNVASALHLMDYGASVVHASISTKITPHGITGYIFLLGKELISRINGNMRG